jgi:hypothetical protein
MRTPPGDRANARSRAKWVASSSAACPRHLRPAQDHRQGLRPRGSVHLDVRAGLRQHAQEGRGFLHARSGRVREIYRFGPIAEKQEEATHERRAGAPTQGNAPGGPSPVACPECTEWGRLLTMPPDPHLPCMHSRDFAFALHPLRARLIFVGMRALSVMASAAKQSRTLGVEIASPQRHCASGSLRSSQ